MRKSRGSMGKYRTHQFEQRSSGGLLVLALILSSLGAGYFVATHYGKDTTEGQKPIALPEVVSKNDSAPGTNRFCCNFIDAAPPPNFDSMLQFSETASGNAVVSEILEKASLAPNFMVISGNVSNALATMNGSTRYIVYNADWLESHKRKARTNWAVYGVLAHEIGHHLNNHVLPGGGSRPDLELQADEWAGSILARLGASLEEAQSCFHLLSAEDSATHPGRAKRLVAVEKGWQTGRDNAKENSEDVERVKEEYRRVKHQVPRNKDPVGEVVKQNVPIPATSNWGKRAEEAIRTMLRGQGGTNVAASIQRIAHPTGSGPALGETRFSHDENSATTVIEVTWRGGFTNSSYSTTVTWKCTKDGHIYATILSDNAAVAVSATNKKSLDEYFATEVYRALKSNMGE